MSWTINGTPLATLGIEQPVLTRRNLEADTLTWSIPVRRSDDAAAFSYGDSIVLADPSGTVRFRGILTGTVRTDQEHQFTASGPWHELEEMVYEQTWYTADDPDAAEPTLVGAPQTRVILHQNDEGEKIDAGQQIAAIISFAAAAGAPLAAGTINIPVTLRWQETANRTCAEAIAACLALITDAVLWWDYTQDPPAAHCARRAALAPVEIDLDAATTADHSVQHLENLERPAVVLRYASIHRANSAGWEKVETDYYPDPLPAGWRRRGLVALIELAGSSYSSSYVTQAVTVRSIPSGLTFSGNSTDDNLIDFWKRRHPVLAGATNIVLRDGVRAAADGSEVVNLPNELASGSIAPWMNVSHQAQRIAVDVAYRLPDGASGQSPWHYEHLETEILATSATTRTYSRLESDDYVAPEPVPVGLAQTLYEQLQGPHYQGSVSLVEREVSFAVTPGQRLGLAGGETAWQTMDAIVQTVTYELETGRTRAEFGTPEHRTPQDLVTQLRALRDQPPATHWQRRFDGKISDTELTQPLATAQTISPGTAPTPTATEPRSFSITPTIAGEVPTVAELQTAFAGVYSTFPPRVGDVIRVSHDSREKVIYTVGPSAAGTDTILDLAFTADSVTWRAKGVQRGVW